MSICLDDLKKPFAPSKISWRIGSTNGGKTKGMALAYIDARDVQDRLDEVCGAAGWQCRYVPMHDKKTVCEIGINIYGPMGTIGRGLDHEWVWKADGAGDSDVEAEKGALSDAFKRAAVKWGIGRYLYDLDSPWVAIESAGRSFKIARPEYARLEAMLAKGAINTSSKAPTAVPQAQTPAKPTVAAEAYAPASVTSEAKTDLQGQKTSEAREWGIWALSKVPSMTKAKLDAFQANNRANLTVLKEADGKTSILLETAMANRLEELFA